MKPLCFLLLVLSLPMLLFSQQKNAAPARPTLAAIQPTAANPTTPAEFFARARQLSDLEAAGVPFHLKATYVATGDTEFTGKGTYEEWWQSKGVWRKEATLGNYKWVQIKNGPRSVALATAAYTPLRVRQIAGLKVFHIVLPQGMHDHWSMSSQPAADDTTDVATDEAPCDPRLKKILCIQKYEFAANGVLLSYRDNDVSETYSDFEPFGKLLFPRKVAVALQDEPVDTATVESLEPLAENNIQRFDTKPIPGLTAIPTEVIETFPAPDLTPPKLIHGVKMKYPKSERKAHPKAVIIVQGTIDATGVIREPFIQLSGGAALDNAALQAVRQWKFKPATHHGHPVMVDLAVIVRFRGRRLF